MLSCQVVMNALERIAPRHLAEDWDNTGLLVGSFSQKVERILVALDVDDIVVAEAIERRADMIVAHHPAIFRGMKQLRTDLPLGRRLAALLTHGIAVAAAHTNLDITRGGVNDVLAARLGLEKLSTFITTEQADGSAESLVRRVAVVGGAGAEFIDTAVRRSADVYLTGDVKYHEAQRAAEQGMHLIDAGHFGTERPVLPVLADLLRAELAAEHGTVEILVTETQCDVFDVII